jgi:hypothetical protein
MTTYGRGSGIRALVETLSAGLPEHGFSHPAVGPDGIEWSKVLFDGYFLSLHIWPEAVPRGDFGFSAGMTVESTRQAEVERVLDLLSCDAAQERAPQDQSRVCVLYVALEWLNGAWEPRRGTFLETMRRWKRVSNVGAKAAADEVLVR